MGMAAILVVWPWPFEQNFFLPHPCPWRRHMIGFNWISGFRGEDVWKCWRCTMDEVIRTSEAYLSYKLTNDLSAQVS